LRTPEKAPSLRSTANIKAGSVMEFPWF
jgi:hypothetical protein